MGPPDACNTDALAAAAPRLPLAQLWRPKEPLAAARPPGRPPLGAALGGARRRAARPSHPGAPRHGPAPAEPAPPFPQPPAAQTASEVGGTPRNKGTGYTNTFSVGGAGSNADFIVKTTQVTGQVVFTATTTSNCYATRQIQITLLVSPAAAAARRALRPAPHARARAARALGQGVGRGRTLPGCRGPRSATAPSKGGLSPSCWEVARAARPHATKGHPFSAPYPRPHPSP
jgi:hypothetical protein